MSKICVFDPACGSGNFLVIANKEMRKIEAEINRRRGELDAPTEIPLTNFRGIELRDYPTEIARLALILAEFQSDVVYRGPLVARAEFLPLDAQNWITCGTRYGSIGSASAHRPAAPSSWSAMTCSPPRSTKRRLSLRMRVARRTSAAIHRILGLLGNRQSRKPSCALC